MNPLDRAIARIATGWRIKFMPEWPPNIAWIVARYWKNGGLRTVAGYYGSEDEAKSAYLRHVRAEMGRAA